LSSIAALRAGAGLAEAAVLPLSQQVIAAHALEPIYTVLPDDDGHIAVEAAAVIRSVLPSSDAAVFGPGMGVTDATLHVTRELLSELRNADTKPAVIDADGLNALSRLPGWWTDLPTLVLTPHPGEMSRLTSLSIAEIQSDRVAVARRFAAEWRSIVVLKGAGTVIAHPDGRARINPTGGPNLATGGTGDVLSGIIGGLLAQRLTPWDAAVAGVFLHGLAGDRVAGRLGDAGTLAGDLLHEIPKARAALHEGERRA
jgi:NAD(P)H-hydrate epimerase